MNCVYDNTRLKEELGDDLPTCLKFTDYLNEMIAMIDPSLVTAASDALSPGKERESGTSAAHD